MTLRIRALLFSAVFALSTLGASAQDEYEYRMEIGVGAGMVSYQGDFNGSILKNMQPSASFILRRVLNPYMDLKLDLTYGTLKGSSADVETWYPVLADDPVEFSNTLMDLGLSFEYNGGTGSGFFDDSGTTVCISGGGGVRIGVAAAKVNGKYVSAGTVSAGSEPVRINYNNMFSSKNFCILSKGITSRLS